MCGIVGIYDSNNFPTKNELEPMVDIMYHRGPDSKGLMKKGPIAMGMRRLSIIDLSDNYLRINTGAEADPSGTIEHDSGIIFVRGQNGGNTMRAFMELGSVDGEFTFFSDISGATDASWASVPVGKDLAVVNAKTFVAQSDVSVKTNIAPIINSKNIIDQLNPVYWNWKDNQKRSCGLIAQDILKISPDAVGGSKDSLALNYNYFIGLLIARMKEMELEMDEFRKRL